MNAKQKPARPKRMKIKARDMAPRKDAKGGRDRSTGQATGKRHHGTIKITKEWGPTAIAPTGG